jgi:hypothetical protein
MALNNATTLSGATFAGTGGTTVNWSSMGQNGNKHPLVVSTDTDLRVRRSIDVSARTPAPSSSAPNGYTQARVSKLYKQPLLLDNGKITVNTCKVEVAYDVETTPEEIQALLDVGAQMLFDADFIGVDLTLSLS